MSRPRVYLAALGDVNDPGTWSGIPYHFLQAAQAAQLIDDGFTLDTRGPAWRRRRLFWNAWRYLSGRGKGGFQYSVSALEHVWLPLRERLLDHRIINCYQLFPPSMVAEKRYRKIFYIDMTLHQLFTFYQMGDTIGPVIAREAIEREKEGYHAAELIVGHSQWAAKSVIEDYGIPGRKVKAIVPGANIDRTAYQHWLAQASMTARTPGQPLKLIFVGKYWDRKGLDRLLEAMVLVLAQGRKIELTVIGCRREDLPPHLRDTPHVHWRGFIDKRSHLQEFLNLVAAADIGCLLSRAEAGGMVLREYHALGLVVLGTAVGGSPEHMFDDAGCAFASDASADEIAQWLVQLIDSPDAFAQLRQRAWERRQEATWDATVNQWRALLT